MIGIGVSIAKKKNNQPWIKVANDHYDRVIADGGTIFDRTLLTSFLQNYYNTRGRLNDIIVCIDPHIFGYKQSSNALTKLYNIQGSDFIQDTAGNRPLFLGWDNTNENYYTCRSAAANNYVSTPVNSGYTNLGDFDIIFKINITTIVGTHYIQNRSYSNGNRQFRLFTSTNTIALQYFLDGTTTITTTSNAISTGLKWYRVKRTASNGDVDFYVSTDGITWTLNKHTTSSSTGNLSNATSDVVYGSIGSGSVGIKHDLYLVKTYRGFYDAGGTLIGQFNPNNYNPVVSKTTWTDSDTNEVFTVARDSVSTGYKGEIIYRNTVLFDGVDDRIDGALTIVNNTAYYDSDYPNGYEIESSAQYIGQKSSAFALAKSGFLIVVNITDSGAMLASMRQLYDNFFFSLNLIDNDYPYLQNEEFGQYDLLKF